MKAAKIDLWDVTLISIFIGQLLIIYMEPTWTNPSLFMQFLYTMSNRTIGFMVAGLVLKKVIQKSNGGK